MLSPEYWSAISTLPTIIMMAPSSGAGRTCCGTSTTGEPATPKTPHWPDGPRQSTNSMSQPKPATITSHGKGVLPNWPGSGSCWPSAALSCLTRRLSRASCAGASSATSRNSSSSWPNRTCQRTTTRPSAACAIWLSAARSAAAPGRSRACPRENGGHRAQDDAGIPLRRLARPRSKSSRRLPSAARFPSTLNCCREVPVEVTRVVPDEVVVMPTATPRPTCRLTAAATPTRRPTPESPFVAGV